MNNNNQNNHSPPLLAPPASSVPVPATLITTTIGVVLNFFPSSHPFSSFPS